MIIGLKKNSLLSQLTGAILASNTLIHGATWDGGGPDSEYSTALNWSDDLVPSSATNSTQDISGAYTVERTVNSSSGRTFVQNGAVLNITSGDHDDSRPGNTIRNFVGNGSTGTVNLSGASTNYGIGHLLAIAHNSNSTGSFYQTDGALNVFRGGNSLVSAYGGIFSRGHSLSIGGDSTSTNVTGIYELSGGSLNTRVGVAVGNNGTFSIIGSAATEIRLGGSGDDTGWFALSSNGTLKAAIDAGGVTPIFVEDRTNSSTVTPEVELQSGSLLDLNFVGSPVYGTWTLIEVENADIIDNGLALAPGVDSNWSFEVDNSGTNGLLKISYPAIPSAVNSVAALIPFLDDDNVNVVMTPGTYQIGPDDVTSGLLDDGDSTLFNFTGNNSTFDFTGVTFEFDTNIFRSFGVIEVAVWGNDLVLKNLTMEDIGTTRPGKTALAVLLDGARNRIEGFTMTLRGSRPYGYGDIFGKGAGPVIGHNKHSAVLIRGDDNHLKDTTIYHRSYGHGIFVQGAVNTLVEGCYVEGELRTTDEVLAEAGTGSRADNVNFMTVWGHLLEGGHTFSLQEDGIRAYNTGQGPDGNTRNTENLTVIDCTVKRMRSGVTIGFTNGIQYVENCVSVQCENAYWIQNGTLINSAADAQVGHVLSSPYGNSGSKNVDVTILKSDGPETNTVLAYLAGPNDDVTFRSDDANVNQNMRILVGGPREGMRYPSNDTGLSANNSALTNLTNYPVELSSSSSNYTCESWGTVTDAGSGNNLTSTTYNTCGGFGMSEIILAEEYCDQSGTSEEPISGGGASIGSINDGDWLRFNNVFFGSGPRFLEAVAAGGTGGSIEVRLGSISGTLLGTINIPANANPNQWQTVTGALTQTRGVHDVFLVFSGGSGDLFKLDSFSFTQWEVDPFERDSEHLIAHWKFDDESGTIATDSTGNGHHGTITSATWVGGAENTALSFNGSTSTVDVPASVLDSVDKELTISMWVYGDASQPANDSVIYAQDGSSRLLNIHLPYSNSEVYWDAGNTSGYDRLNTPASTSQFAGQWNHWTFVKSATDQDMLIYHNGVLHAAEQGGTQEIGTPDVPISIGSRLGGSNYSGLIDEVKFHDVALSELEIKSLYESFELNTALDSWRYTNFGTYENSGISANGFDADFDGVSNLIEYATGNDPTNGSDSYALEVKNSLSNPSELMVTFERIVDTNLTYTLEGTNDLSLMSWPTVWTGSGVANGTVTISESLWPENQPFYFFRLGVSYEDDY